MSFFLVNNEGTLEMKACEVKGEKKSEGKENNQRTTKTVWKEKKENCETFQLP